MTLIAGELNIEVLPLKVIDIEKFLENTKLTHESDSSFNREEKAYFHRNGKEYPWHRRILEHNGVIFHDYRNVNPFNSIIHLIDDLPIKHNARVVLMIYQKVQPSYDFDFHFDKDEEYGFRICYGLDTDTVFVDFSKLKSEFQYVRNSLEKIKSYMLESEIYSLIPLRANTIFCFNGENYPHRVPVVNHNSPRMSIIVRGVLDHERFSKLKYTQQINA